MAIARLSRLRTVAARQPSFLVLTTSMNHYCEAVDELVRIAEIKHAAIVVVGHHRSWLGELMHGSVSARLRRRLPDVQVVEVTEPTVLVEQEELQVALDDDAML